MLFLCSIYTQAVELDGPGQAVALAYLAVDAVSTTTRFGLRPRPVAMTTIVLHPYQWFLSDWASHRKLIDFFFALVDAVSTGS